MIETGIQCQGSSVNPLAFGPGEVWTLPTANWPADVEFVPTSAPGAQREDFTNRVVVERVRRRENELARYTVIVGEIDLERTVTIDRGTAAEILPGRRAVFGDDLLSSLSKALREG